MASKLAALITGGGRGIGKAISKRLSEDRDRACLIVGRTEKSLRETASEIEAGGGSCAVVVGDITEPATLDAIQAELTRLDWSVSSLILNAGIGKGGPTGSFPPALFDEIMKLNVSSCLPLIQLVLPGMTARSSGTICFISSIAGLRGLGHETAYSVSKHAQIGFAKSLALEYGKQGICVVPICPGFVESEMTDRSIASLARRKSIGHDEARAIIEKVNPQRRIIPAEEVAEMVSFVCSGKVPALSGHPIILTGGAS